MTAVPDGKWFCLECENDAGAQGAKKGKKKAKAPAAEGGDNTLELKAVGKRKVPTKVKAGGRFHVSISRAKY